MKKVLLPCCAIYQPYIKAICHFLAGKKAQWLLNEFDANNKKRIDRYKKIIRKSGFSGMFSAYSID